MLKHFYSTLIKAIIGLVLVGTMLVGCGDSSDTTTVEESKPKPRTAIDLSTGLPTSLLASATWGKDGATCESKFKDDKEMVDFCKYLWENPERFVLAGYYYDAAFFGSITAANKEIGTPPKGYTLQEISRNTQDLVAQSLILSYYITKLGKDAKDKPTLIAKDSVLHNNCGYKASNQDRTITIIKSLEENANANVNKSKVLGEILALAECTAGIFVDNPQYLMSKHPIVDGAASMLPLWAVGQGNLTLKNMDKYKEFAIKANAELARFDNLFYEEAVNILKDEYWEKKELWGSYIVPYKLDEYFSK